MKAKIFSIIVCALLVGMYSAHSEENREKKGKKKFDMKHMAHRMVAREADTDGDGRLSEEERKGIREKAKAFRERMLEKYDKDKSGELSEEEKKAAAQDMREKIRAELIKRFDKDGDGKLSEEERKAAKETMKKRHEERKDKKCKEKRGEEAEGITNADLQEELDWDTLG